MIRGIVFRRDTEATQGLCLPRYNLHSDRVHTNFLSS